MTRPVWQIETLRKTFFVPSSAAIPVPEGGLWKSIAGTDPTDQTVKPLLKTSTESGAWNGYSLTIGSQPGRIDFILSALEVSHDLPNIGTYQDTIEAFNALIIPQGLVSVARLAFGAVALAPYGSHEECYKGLGEIINHVQISPDSREFLYRINNPSKSNAYDNLNLNCISTWGAIKVVRINMSESKSSEDIKYAIRAELDISTDAELTLPSDVDIATLFQEFSGLGLSVLDLGPKP